ncbi:Uncharacterized protein YjbI, contains pentapeptide repeats [Mucilaginibacter pineti]|uniref:Uncharacterized protein YjbI, contains pentapeptide repeats n=1 Tax=Mucilaginibacter pineti TaxID=1391627 RepID=A0A1G7C1V0_9SPHI|nr:pentapeptide repeat-containing protein [Mucilaginibacter pineti]SDE32750.1 Uncharacterized protein YjbI, contains pentapeptide repeats [Mucilaginibacter pineti]
MESNNIERVVIKQAQKILEVNEARLDGSTFGIMMMNNASFNNVSIQDLKIHDADLTGLEISNARLGGAYFHNIGMPPKGHPAYKEGAQQRPLRFEDCNLQGTTITNCNLSNVAITNVNIQDLKIHDADLTGLEISNARLGGAYIHNIGMPPKGHPAYKEGAQQRPLRFEDCNLQGTTITDCNLSNVAITDSNTTGMTINGILLADLLSAYNKR